MRIVADRYELRERLGGGATADVYHAHDRHLGRDVALKLMRPAMAADVELLERFDREAAALAAVTHENVVAVSDHGTWDGAPYLAMELVEGATLQQLLRARGRLDETSVIRVARQMLAALAAAHACGVIHRDLKPANILVAPDGLVKVTDFGIAHLAAMTQLTRTGEVLGTPRYAAPEQVDGRVDSRSDIYALGAVLYELLAGQPAVPGETPSEIVRNQLRGRPTPLRTLAPHVSRQLVRVVMRALEQDPARRFATPGEMLDALRPREAAPLPALAARPRSGAFVRAFGTLVAAVAVLGVFATAALAHFPDAAPLLAFAHTSAPTVATRAPTLVPSAVVKSAPPTAAAPSTPAPSATTTPATTPAPTLPSVSGGVAAGTRASTTRPVAAPDPRATVALFYQLVSAHRYDDAAALWSARMRAAYPPATNIYGRFDRTASISLRSATISSQTDTTATVNADIVEVLVDGTTREWVGQWSLVRSGTTWLMDAPALRAA